MNKHFYFSFYPSMERFPKQGRATHYLPNSGIITLDEPLVDYIYRCRVYGKPARLFGQGWYDKRSRQFNAGLEIPRGSIVQDLTEEHSREAAESNLMFLFQEDSE
jgi:hypothetical protein